MQKTAYEMRISDWSSDVCSSDLERLSSCHATPALGPAGRGFANAAAIVETDLEPPDLLARLKSIERTFGSRGGRRWGPRVPYLDILLWPDGPYEGEGLVIPHPAFRDRLFFLDPLADLAPAGRVPVNSFTLRPLPRPRPRPQPVNPPP